MKASEIQVGGQYRARVSGRHVTVRVDKIRTRNGYGSTPDRTVYDVTNLSTNRKLTFESAAKFHGAVSQPASKQPTPTTPAIQPTSAVASATAWREVSPIMHRRVLNGYILDVWMNGGNGWTVTTRKGIDGESVTHHSYKQELAAAQKAAEEIAVPTTSTQPITLDTADTARADFNRRAQEALENSPPQTDEDEEDEQGSDPTIHAPTAAVALTSSSPTDTAAESASLQDGAIQAPDEVTTTTEVIECEGKQRRPFSGAGTALPSSHPASSHSDVNTAESMGYGSTDTIIGNAGFASRIATLPEVPTGPQLTAEQQDILALAVQIEAARMSGQRVLVIGAGAGTGKTFTLRQLEEVLSGRGQYTAFNTKLCAESKSKFQRAAVNTTHSLAFRAVGHKFQPRLKAPRIRSYEVAARLGIGDFIIELSPKLAPPDAEGKPATKRLKAAYLAGQVLVAIDRFCMSDKMELDPTLFRWFEGIDAAGKGGEDGYPPERANNERVRAYLMPYLRKAWEDLSDPQGGLLPFKHDIYVKMWQMGTGDDRPIIAANYILLDEAQDTAPVMLDILRRQTHAMLILVGDDNQQIYEWRGAVNAMATFPGAPRRLLSQSFRFGQTVADVANSVLATLKEPTDLIMKGSPTIPSRVCKVEEPRCYLFRTNAGAIGRLMRARKEGKYGHLIGKVDDIVNFCKAALDLQAIPSKGTAHQELGCFKDWKEVQEYSKEDEGADLRLMVKLIDEFKAKEIIEALDNMPSQEDADLILSTAHRSKGLEWSSVKLGADFPTANKMTDADRRLLYVAVTRAQEELDISACPTFVGGYEKAGGGEDGDGGEGRFIPGLDITYSQEMPSAEALDVHRRGIKGTLRMSKEGRDLVEEFNKLPANELSALQSALGAEPQKEQKPQAKDTPDDFTWANMDGAWCVRGPKDRQGAQVTVTRKNGTTSQENLRSVVRKIGDIWFYATK